MGYNSDVGGGAMITDQFGDDKEKCFGPSSGMGASSYSETGQNCSAAHSEGVTV